MPLLKCLAALRPIRGSWFDPFRHSQERQAQAQLLSWFETWLQLMHNTPSMLQHSINTERILDLFGQVKGFGRVRLESFHKVAPEIQKSIELKHNLEHHEQD